MTSHRILNDFLWAFSSVGDGLLDDPGDAGSIEVTLWGQICSVATAGTETRTLDQPRFPGILAAVALETDGGDMTLTVTGGYNHDGNTSITFDDAGDFIVVYSIDVGGSFYWRVIGQEGTNVSTEEGVFDSLTATTAAITTMTSPTVAAEHGAGVIGTGVAPSTSRSTRDGVIITDIKLDLTGLASVATANDVIGLSAGGVAYIGQNVVATNGVIFKMELICLETPVGGDDDVNVVADASALLEYNGAGGVAYGVNGGDAVAGQVVENLVQGLTANHYLYLTAGTGDTAAAYTAGQFIVRLHGYPVLT